MTRALSAGSALIISERRRQVEVEGYTAEHDTEHGPGVLARAASEYVAARWDWRWPSVFWPWSPEAFKPRDRISNLVRAGALYLAALDVVDPEVSPRWANERPEELQRHLDRVTAELDALLLAARATWVHGEAATRQIAAMTARLTGHGDTSPSEQPDERWLSGSDSDRVADVWEDSMKREWL